MKFLYLKKWAFALSAILFLPSLTYAHTGAGHTIGFLHGLSHPVSGLDHILAMVAVGIWAARISGRAVWVVPTTFVCVMSIGSILGAAGIAVPFVEQGIVLSVLILGVLIAAAARLPLSAGAALAGLFALFHGHAHGAEMPSAISGFVYGIGFAVSTAILHLSGICFGVFFQKSARLRAVRFAGSAIALAGIYLLIP